MVSAMLFLYIIVNGFYVVHDIVHDVVHNVVHNVVHDVVHDCT